MVYAFHNLYDENFHLALLLLSGKGEEDHVTIYIQQCINNCVTNCVNVVIKQLASISQETRQC